jgi:TPR repeat protein
MFGMGLGVPQSEAQSFNWYLRAARQGNPDAQVWTGDRYLFGVGTPKNYFSAAKWFRLAAEGGDVRGQLSLGELYTEGQGVPRDYVLAHMWLNLAAAQNGNESASRSAREKRDQLAVKMTPAHIAEAQRLAREWKPTK